MLRYLKEAFLVRPRVPGLGNVPVNILGMAGFGILGFGHPGFWLLGLGLEALFLFSLATHSGFQNLVNAKAAKFSSEDTEVRRQALIDALPSDSKKRYTEFRAKCANVLDVYQSSQAESYVMDESSRVLRNLKWVYLKLLVARNNMVTVSRSTSEAELTRRIAELEKLLKNEDEPESLKASQGATLEILRKRRENIRRKTETLAEIDSDCTRVESQVDLILENASMAGKPSTISADLDFSSNVLDTSFYGESEKDVQDIDKTYGGNTQAKVSN